MNEPNADASDRELADHFDRVRGRGEWGEPEPVLQPERLEVTLSVRFRSAEIATIRSRAAAAGLKPTAYIRQCTLTVEQPPIDRARISRTVDALARDLDDLRRATG
ncbi:MAG TPA: hypothetical protein VIC62_13705 [Nakamurella sp.]|jgi:hypothetical protein